jgi:hypothetical protein
MRAREHTNTHRSNCSTTTLPFGPISCERMSEMSLTYTHIKDTHQHESEKHTHQRTKKAHPTCTHTHTHTREDLITRHVLEHTAFTSSSLTATRQSWSEIFLQRAAGPFASSSTTLCGAYSVIRIPTPAFLGTWPGFADTFESAFGMISSRLRVPQTLHLLSLAAAWSSHMRSLSEVIVCSAVASLSRSLWRASRLAVESAGGHRHIQRAARAYTHIQTRNRSVGISQETRAPSCMSRLARQTCRSSVRRGS